MKSALQMKSTIVDEMKPVLYSDEVGFHHEVISSIIDGFIPSGGRISMKKGLHFREVLFSGASDGT